MLLSCLGIAAAALRLTLPPPLLLCLLLSLLSFPTAVVSLVLSCTSAPLSDTAPRVFKVGLEGSSPQTQPKIGGPGIQWRNADGYVADESGPQDRLVRHMFTRRFTSNVFVDRGVFRSAIEILYSLVR